MSGVLIYHGVRHDLKIEDAFLKEKLRGCKLFEIRKNDRDFKVGDTVEYRKSSDIMTETHTYVITYITDYKQMEGYVVFGEKHIATVYE